MALKLKLGVISIGSIGTNIGCLRVFDVQPTKFFKYLSENDLTLSEENPLDAVHRFLLFVCYPDDSVIEDKIPSEVSLRIEDMKELDSKSLNDICELYLLGNVHLLLPKKDIENGEIDLASDSLFEIHLEEGESYVELLYRTLIEKLKRRNEENKKLKELYENSAFSEAINYDLQMVSAMAADLAKYNKTEDYRENISAWKPMNEELLKENIVLAQTVKNNLKGWGPINPSISEKPVDLSKISSGYKEQVELKKASERLKQEKYEKPFKDLSEKLSALIGRNDQYIGYAISNNDVQIKMFNSIKESSEASDNHAKENIKLSKLVFIVSIISAVLAAAGIVISGLGIYFSSLGTSFDESTIERFDGYAHSISDRMNLNIESMISNQKELIEEFKKLQKVNNEKLESLQEEFEVLKEENQEYLDRISTLEGRLNEGK
jgi:uncharacterized Tic20 family protein